MTKLENLRNVKEKLIEQLSEGELETSQYYENAYKLFLKEGIVQGPYEDATRDVSIRLAVGLLQKLPAEEYWGIEKAYISLDEERLSTEAQEDLRKYYEFKNKTRDYLRQKLVGRQVLESQFQETVKDYLMNQTNLSDITSPKIQNEMVLRIFSGLALEEEFKVQKDPEKVGNYDLQGLENLLSDL